MSEDPAGTPAPGEAAYDVGPRNQPTDPPIVFDLPVTPDPNYCVELVADMHEATHIERLDGYDDDYLMRHWVTWQVAYKGHLLGNASDEAEAHRWIEDMRRMEAAGEYDPVAAERNRLTHGADRAMLDA